MWDNPLGISVGYADLYPAGIPKQRIDVTGLPSGQYWLEVVVDPNGLVMETDKNNNAEQILVNLTIPHPVTIDGDYNADLVVDAGDYVTFRDHIGAPAGSLPNDPNSSAIGADQFETWRAEHGASLPTSVGTGGAPAPEPASVALLCVGLLTLPRQRGCGRPHGAR